MDGISAVKTLAMAVLLAVIGGQALAHTQAEKTFYLQSRMVLQLNPRDATAGNAVGTGPSWSAQRARRRSQRCCRRRCPDRTLGTA